MIFDDCAFEDMIQGIGDPLPKNRRGFVDTGKLQQGDIQYSTPSKSRLAVNNIIKSVNQFGVRADLLIAPITELAIGLNAQNAKTFNECLHKETPDERMEALKTWARKNQLNSFHSFCEMYNNEVSQALLALTGYKASNTSSNTDRNFNRFLKILQATLVEPSLTEDLSKLKEDIKEITVPPDSTAREQIVKWKESLVNHSLDYLKDTYLGWLSKLGGQYSARSSVYQEFNRHAKSVTVLSSKVFLQSFKGRQLRDELAKEEFLSALSGIYEKNQCVDIEPSDLDSFVKKFESVLNKPSVNFSETSKLDLLSKAFSALSSHSQEQLKTTLLSRTQDQTKQQSIYDYLVATERGSELSVAYSSQSSNPWLIIYPGGNCFGFTMNEVQGKEAKGAKHVIDFDLLYNQKNQAAIKGRKDLSKGFVIEAQPMIESMLHDLANGDTMTLGFGSSGGGPGHIISLKRIDTEAFKGYEFVDCNNVRIRWNWKPEDAAKYAADHIQAQSYTDPTCYLDLTRFRADANKISWKRFTRWLSSLLPSTKASPVENFHKVKTKEVLSSSPSDQVMDGSTLYVKFESHKPSNYYGWKKLSDLNLTTEKYGCLLRGQTCKIKFNEKDQDGNEVKIPVELSHCVAVRNHHHKKSTRAELLAKKGEEVNEADHAAVGKLIDNLSSLEAQSINYEHMGRKYQDAIMAKIEHWFSSKGQAFTADHKQHGIRRVISTVVDLGTVMDDDDDEEDDDDIDLDTIAPQISYQFLSEWCDKIFVHDSNRFLGRLFDACGGTEISTIENFKHLQVMLHTTLEAGKKNLCVEYLKYVAEQYPSTRIAGPSSKFYRYLSEFIKELASLDPDNLKICFEQFKDKPERPWMMASINLIEDTKTLQTILKVAPNEIKKQIVVNWLAKEFKNKNDFNATVRQLNTTPVDYQKLAAIFSCTTWDACQQVITKATPVSRRRVKQDSQGGQGGRRVKGNKEQRTKGGSQALNRSHRIYPGDKRCKEKIPNVAQDLTQSVQCLINKISNPQVDSPQLQQAIEMVLIKDARTIRGELQGQRAAAQFNDKATLLDNVWKKMTSQEKQPFIPRITQLMKQSPICRVQGTKMILKVIPPNDFYRNGVNTVGADNLFSIFLGALKTPSALFKTKGESLNAQNPSTKLLSKRGFLVSMYENIPQKDRLTCLNSLLQRVALREQGQRAPVEKDVLGSLLKQKKHYQQVARVILQSVSVESRSAKKRPAFSPDQQQALLKKLGAPPQSTNQPSLLGRAFLVVVCRIPSTAVSNKSQLLEGVWPKLNQTDQEYIMSHIGSKQMRKYGLDKGPGPHNRNHMQP